MKIPRYILIIILICALALTSCNIFRERLDNKSGFSQYLKETESSILQEEWNKAGKSLELSQQAWKRIKPIIQVDIDHDYVNNIESNFVTLEAFIENREKSLSLAAIRLIQKYWASIGEM